MCTCYYNSFKSIWLVLINLLLVPFSFNNKLLFSAMQIANFRIFRSLWCQTYYDSLHKSAKWVNLNCWAPSSSEKLLSIKSRFSSVWLPNNLNLFRYSLRPSHLYTNGWDTETKKLCKKWVKLDEKWV